MHNEAAGTRLFVAVAIDQNQYNLNGHNFT